MNECVVKVNGQTRRERVKDNVLLLDFLRDKLEVRSVKAACWRGECGLCTVLLNGKLVKSCIVLAVEANGGEVTTVEGITDGSKLAPIQQAFVEHGASQCGFCTPAFVLTCHELLKHNPRPTEREVEEAVSGLVCRCGTYAQIREAIASVSQPPTRAEALQKLGKGVR
ncbi:MAG: (2Fe-2S)-binding protein [Nitrososphaerales archaeon]|nr:(2Fe-2S)-binding protein [Nitrososphaerales archaeon]